MNAHEEAMPGVTIRFRTSELRKVGGKKVVSVTLDAEVNDEDVWEAARKRLDGMKIYTVDDFKTEILAALREENVKLVSRHSDVVESNQVLTAENQRMKAALSVLSINLQAGGLGFQGAPR